MWKLCKYPEPPGILDDTGTISRTPENHRNKKILFRTLIFPNWTCYDKFSHSGGSCFRLHSGYFQVMVSTKYHWPLPLCSKCENRYRPHSSRLWKEDCKFPSSQRNGEKQTLYSFLSVFRPTLRSVSRTFLSNPTTLFLSNSHNGN